MTSQEQAGSGESQPESPPNRLLGVAIRLQGKGSFLPVGNSFGNHTDAEIQNSGLKGTKGAHQGAGTKDSPEGGSKIIGYIHNYPNC
jgi:hypothetical protein